MARLDRALPHNAPGELYVDSSCIDCDTCRWMVPGVFVEREGQASVGRQPRDGDEWLRAEMALLSCPTASIGTVRRRDMGLAQRALPDPIQGGVYHTGYHGEESYGATSYLIVREAGNVLVDSPRFTQPLVRRVEELGGVRTLFLTHRDDVLDHARWAEHFGCERVLHLCDRTNATLAVEHWLGGREPVQLDDELLAIPTPGHTQGSACLLYAGRFLFTGDHLAWSEPLGHLYAFRRACWYDWGTLIESTARLRGHPVEWVLPGHGRRAQFAPGGFDAELERALAWMRAEGR